jgi:hypothetical protein
LENIRIPNLKPWLDPSIPSQRELIVSIFKELLVAEETAKKGFQMMSDPKLVKPSAILEKNLSELVEEEDGHVELCKQVLVGLAAKDFEPSEESKRFWSPSDGEYGTAYPLSAAGACLLATISEGFGMVWFVNLEAVLKDSLPKRVLQTFIQDEGGHLSACEIVIKDTLAKDPSANKELMETLNLFLNRARVPARASKRLAESAGLDYYECAARALDANLDRLESLGLKLGFKWGFLRKTASRTGMLKTLVRLYL